MNDERARLHVRDAVYMVMHRNSGRVYVGMTTQTVAQRWKQHRIDATGAKQSATHLHCAIRAHGADAFDVFVLESAIERGALPVREQQYVAALRSNVPGRGFNLTAGGEVSPALDPRVRAKISAAQKGRTHSPEHRAKVAAGLRGHKRSADEIERSAAARRGRKATPETIERMRASHLGKSLPKDVIERRNAAIAAAHSTPEARAAQAERTRLAWSDPARREARMHSLMAAAQRRRDAGGYSAAGRVITDAQRAAYSAAARKRWAAVKGN